MSNDMLNAALDYARQGLPVLPLWGLLPVTSNDGRLLCRCGKLDCKRGKHPMHKLVRHGSLQATTHEPTVVHFWGVVAPEANVGIATGPHAVGLDVDPREGGREKLAELTAEHGPLPQTWRARTGGGGDHYLFRPVPDSEVRNFQAGKRGAPLNGLDLRGKGGLLVAAPSRHESGNAYRWIVTPRSMPIAPMPAWFGKVFKHPRSAKMTPEDWEKLVRNGADAGLRHPSLLKLTGHLLARRVDPHVVLEIAHAYNEARCRPPKTRQEVFKIVNWCAGQKLPRCDEGEGSP
jgi:Bifunctional DNA primase/polymerase, N-terminal/Primase C terminal 1 (PriCT-1)